jgi:hypothetical protein
VAYTERTTAGGGVPAEETGGTTSAPAMTQPATNGKPTSQRALFILGHLPRNKG